MIVSLNSEQGRLDKMIVILIRNISNSLSVSHCVHCLAALLSLKSTVDAVYVTGVLSIFTILGGCLDSEENNKVLQLLSSSLKDGTEFIKSISVSGKPFSVEQAINELLSYVVSVGKNADFVLSMFLAEMELITRRSTHRFIESVVSVLCIMSECISKMTGSDFNKESLVLVNGFFSNLIKVLYVEPCFQSEKMTGLFSNMSLMLKSSSKSKAKDAGDCISFVHRLFTGEESVNVYLDKPPLAVEGILNSCPAFCSATREFQLDKGDFRNHFKNRRVLDDTQSDLSAAHSVKLRVSCFSETTEETENELSDDDEDVFGNDDDTAIPGIGELSQDGDEQDFKDSQPDADIDIPGVYESEGMIRDLSSTNTSSLSFPVFLGMNTLLSSIKDAAIENHWNTSSDALFEAKRRTSSDQSSDDDFENEKDVGRMISDPPSDDEDDDDSNIIQGGDDSDMGDEQ